MSIRPSTSHNPEWAPRFSGTVTVTFSAAHSLPGLEPGHRARRSHGHDFTATFTFDAGALSYPGVVVDHTMRNEIVRHVEDGLDHRDLDRLLDRPATCEAIAAHLATWWYQRSARPAEHAGLVSVTVATAVGANGSVHLPGPVGDAR